jgi:hypothetical protein
VTEHFCAFFFFASVSLSSSPYFSPLLKQTLAHTRTQSTFFSFTHTIHFLLLLHPVHTIPILDSTLPNGPSLHACQSLLFQCQPITPHPAGLSMDCLHAHPMYWFHGNYNKLMPLNCYPWNNLLLMSGSKLSHAGNEQEKSVKARLSPSVSQSPKTGSSALLWHQSIVQDYPSHRLVSSAMTGEQTGMLYNPEGS